MPSEHPLLDAIVVFLGAAIAGIAIARLLRVNAILGFFVAGAVVGEHGLHVLPHTDGVHILAELGVAFLLFDIGGHLSPRKLWESRHDLLGLGPLQVGATTVVIAGLAKLLGLPWTEALIVGAGLSLSSTAIALQVIKSRGDSGSPVGRRALSLLIFQDLFVVLLLVLLPALAGQDEGGVGQTLLATLLNLGVAVAGVVLIGQFVFQPAFAWITRTGNDELFTFAALFVVLAVAWAASLLGLSMPLGAFLAGIALSVSRFSYLVHAEVAPFRGLLLSLFFISVGMLLPLDLFVERPVLILGLTGLLILAKAVVLFVCGLLFRIGKGVAANLALTMAQGSEFGFVLFAAAGELGLIGAETQGLVVAVIGITLALTPVIAKVGVGLGERIERAGTVDAGEAPAPPTQGKVLIVGFDDVGRDLARVLTAAEVDYIALTSDRERVACARSQGFAVEHGSPDRPRGIAILTKGDAQSVVVIPKSDEISRQIIGTVRRVCPRIPIYAATEDPAYFAELDEMGLADALLKNDNSACELARRILASRGFSAADIDAVCAVVAAETPGEELVASL